MEKRRKEGTCFKCTVTRRATIAENVELLGASQIRKEARRIPVTTG